MPRRATRKSYRPSTPAASGGIEGILSGLSSLLGTLSELAEKGEELRRSGDLKTASGKDVKFHYGISVRTANGGRDLTVEPFGNMHTPAPKAAGVKQTGVKEVREPLTDVFEEDDHVLVVVEMPGISENDVSTELQGDILTVTASRGAKHYRKEVLLPGAPKAGFKPSDLSRTSTNGVFQFRLRK